MTEITYGSQVALRVSDSGKYVMCDLNADAGLIATTDAIQAWEKFLILHPTSPWENMHNEINDGDPICLLAVNNRFVMADFSDQASLWGQPHAYAQSVKNWETFTIHTLNGSPTVKHGGTIALKDDYQHYLACRRDITEQPIQGGWARQIDSWETFEIINPHQEEYNQQQLALSLERVQINEMKKQLDEERSSVTTREEQLRISEEAVQELYNKLANERASISSREDAYENKSAELNRISEELQRITTMPDELIRYLDSLMKSSTDSIIRQRSEFSEAAVELSRRISLDSHYQEINRHIAQSLPGAHSVVQLLDEAERLLSRADTAIMMVMQANDNANELNMLSFPPADLL